MKKWYLIFCMCSLVVCLFLIRRRDASVDHYNSGCRYYTAGQYNTAGQYGAGGKYDLAIIEFTKAIEINPRYAQAYNNRGLAYDAKGE
jgi:tetratricopeptide (TPR) repeat protein